MKRTIFFLCLVLSALESGIAKADSYKYRPYVGATYAFASARADKAKPNYNIGGIYIGSEYGKYFSTEVFYNQSTYDNNYINNLRTRTSYRSYGLDLMAYLPLDCYNRFDFVATAGAEYVFAKKIKGEKHHNDSGLGYRFGGGLKYNFNADWQAKALARYVKFNNVSDFDHQIEYSLNIEYHF